MKTAIVLLSGGLDSSTTLAIAKSEGLDPVALTFSYWQRHTREVEAARDVALAFEVREHRVIRLNFAQIGGSALTTKSMEVPLNRSLDKISTGVPDTYVPARNTVFLSFALAWAEARDADSIYIGATAVDFSGYPDCRPEFFEAFREVSRLGTKRGIEGRPIEIRHPLIALSKAEIVRKAIALDVPLDLTWSCYKGGEIACGLCDACQLRLKGFAEAGVTDPIAYEAFPQWFAGGQLNSRSNKPSAVAGRR